MVDLETYCIGLELSDGGQVYLKSTWESSNFSIVALDGVHAWSRIVSTKEVVSIATSWNIDVGEFMKSARSHLSRQHPTSHYLMSAAKGIDVVQLSFTIDDLLEGDDGNKTLNFELRLTRMSDEGAVVRDMLDYLLDSKNKLKEQLAEAENQLQKKIHVASEPEPGITLSLARPNANPRRQSTSSFMEPRALDLGKFNHSEDRDTASMCSLSPTRGLGQVHHHTAKVSTQLSPAPSFDLQERGTEQTGKSNVKMEREPVPFFNVPRSPAVFEGRMGLRNNNLSVRAHEASVVGITLSPNIMRVLNNLSVTGTMKRNGMDHDHRVENLQDRREEGQVTTGGGGDERGVRITEVRSPARSEVHEDEGRGRTTTILRQKNPISEGQAELKANGAADLTRPLKHNSELEEDTTYQKSDTRNWSGFYVKENLPGSNAGEAGRSEVRGLNKSATGEAKEISDKEPTSKVTLKDVRQNCSHSDSGLRATAACLEKMRGQWLNEPRSAEGNHEKYQEQQTLADRKAGGPVRYEHFTEKVSVELPCNDDIIDTTVATSFTTDDDKSPVADPPEYARQKSTCSQPPMVEHQGRKRALEDREEDFRGKTLRPSKLGVDYADSKGTEGTYRSRGTENRSARNFYTNAKHEVVDLEDLSEEVEDAGKYKVGETFLIPDEPPGFARNTIGELLRRKREDAAASEGRGRGRGRGRRRTQGEPLSRGFPGKRRQGRRYHDDSSPSEEPNVLNPDELNGDNFVVPDPDFCNFDKERTEDLIFPGQIWAIYDEKDGFPRLWAHIEKVSRKPRFKVLVTWLIPYNPTEAQDLLKSSGYSISCGMFKYGDQHVLNSINTFSHGMEFNRVGRNLVTIYPKKGELWALYRKKMLQPPAKPCFRVVEVVEDVERDKQPSFQVLKRVAGFRTVYQAEFQPGSIAANLLYLFSHRVPACKLQGHEGSVPPFLKGCWDVDPAGLPPPDTQDE